jgi:hypothetical protein
MSFLARTSSDLRAGKATWRVVLTLDFVVLAITVAWAIV